MNWNYMQPVKICFGNGSVKSLNEIIDKVGGHKGLLICDGTFVKNGFANQLQQDSEGTLIQLYSEVLPNTDVKSVDACADIIRNYNIDFVVALGGGSVIDCGKAAATVCMTEDSICKYHGTGVTLPNKHIPLIAIPTTSGTGSEVTCVSVLTDYDLHKKAPVVSDSFYPEYAIVDPGLTYSVPPHITASTGLDVLSHAIEGYWSKGHQPICDICAIHAAGYVFEYLERCYHNPYDKEAREKLSEASIIAGLSFSIPKTTSSHACSFPLTNLLGIPHGEACALTLDYFARINKDADGGRVQLFAKKLGFDNVDQMADRIVEMKKTMNMRMDLKDFSLTEEQVTELVKISRHPNLYNNPVDITDEMLNDMYQQLR